MWGFLTVVLMACAPADSDGTSTDVLGHGGEAGSGEGGAGGTGATSAGGNGGTGGTGGGGTGGGGTGGSGGGGGGGTGPVDADGDGFDAGADCDDQDEAIYPGATEVCDAADVDEDCDFLADNDDIDVDLATGTRYFPDLDGDGYGDANHPGVLLCDSTGFYPEDDSTDCDDLSADRNPGAVEVCDPDNLDEDCDSVADDADPNTSPPTKNVFYLDADSDGFGDLSDPGQSGCDATIDHPATDHTDCDDDNAAVNPGAPELCSDGHVDEDCDGLVDDEDPSSDGLSFSLWYADNDADGYGDDADLGVFACFLLDGAKVAGDCNDEDPDVSPAETEVCDPDDADEDCDNLVEEADPSIDPLSLSLSAIDMDGDGFGGTLVPTCDEGAPGGDCDDSNALIYPGAIEIPCSGVVESCTGVDANISVPADEPTVRDAVDVAVAGDVLCVSAGTYSDSLPIEIDVDELQLVSVSGAGSTTLKRTGGANAVVVVSGHRVSIQGFTIRDGPESGVRVAGGDDFVLSDSVIEANGDPGVDGGGVRIAASRATVRDTTFRDNVGNYGAGLWAFDATGLTVRDNVFEGNVATSKGGGMRLHTVVDFVSSGNLFEGNNADAGGGLALLSSEGTATGDIFVANSAVTTAGAVYVDASPNILLDGLDVSFSTAPEVGAFHQLFSDGTTLLNSVFTSNGSVTSAAAVAIESSNNIVMRSVTFDNNVSVSLGTAQMVGGTDLVVEDCTFLHNVGSLVGALTFLDSANILVATSTFEENEIVGDSGAALAFSTSANVLTLDNVIRDNNVGEIGGGIVDSDVTGVTHDGDEIKNNDAVIIGGGIFCAFSSGYSEVGTTVSMNAPSQVLCLSCSAGCVAH